MKWKVLTFVFGLTVLFAIFTHFAIADGEKEISKVIIPGASVERTVEYSGTKSEYKKAVSDKEKAIKTQGGKAMVNESKQPIKKETIRGEVGGAVHGIGASKSREKSIGTTSAAEEALKNQDKKK